MVFWRCSGVLVVFLKFSLTSYSPYRLISAFRSI